MGVGENLQRSLQAQRVTPISVTEACNQWMCWITHEGHTWDQGVAWAPTWQGHQTRRTWGSHGGNGSGPEGK